MLQALRLIAFHIAPNGQHIRMYVRTSSSLKCASSSNNSAVDEPISACNSRTSVTYVSTYVRNWAASLKPLFHVRWAVVSAIRTVCCRLVVSCRLACASRRAARDSRLEVLVLLVKGVLAMMLPVVKPFSNIPAKSNLSEDQRRT